MSPIERVRARAEAFEFLGVGPSANPKEIHAAWRRAAMETHPDRNDGRTERFDCARAAYGLLTGDDAEGQHWNAARTRLRQSGEGGARPRMSRPKLPVHVNALSREDRSTCRALLESSAPSGNDATSSLRTGAVEGSSSTDHVPASVERQGRNLVYRVATPLVRGVNRVALPTALLLGQEPTRPEIVAFRSSIAGDGEVVLSDTVRERHFRGVRSLRIQFNAA